MDESALAAAFEQRRASLLAIATHVLGRAADAEDAIQETWLRLARSDPATIDNLDGWLRTVLVRVCLDVLRAPRTRREQPVDMTLADRLEHAQATLAPAPPDAPEVRAERADALGRALIVLLDALTPDERVAFVLQDVFGVPFAEIAPLVGRSEQAAKQLASRARRKVRGAPEVSTRRLTVEKRAVESFLAAASTGDIGAVLAVLAPGVVRRADPALLPPGVPALVRGTSEVGKSTMLLGSRAALAELALVDGHVGALVALDGAVALALRFTVDAAGLISAYEVIADPAAIATLRLGLLDRHAAGQDAAGHDGPDDGLEH